MSSCRSIRGFQFPVFPSGAEGTFFIWSRAHASLCKAAESKPRPSSVLVTLLLYDEGGFETS